MTSFSDRFLSETIEIINAIDAGEIEKIAVGLARLRDAGGRLFILGVGGSAGHASHAVNDFRKICGFEAYAPTDNVSELTARVNDDGWETVFSKWLEGSRINGGDALLILSVGGGNAEKNVSINIIRAIDLAKSVGAAIYSIVGRDGASPPVGGWAFPFALLRQQQAANERAPERYHYRPLLRADAAEDSLQGAPPRALQPAHLLMADPRPHAGGRPRRWWLGDTRRDGVRLRRGDRRFWGALV
jgi:D-sedoheptulose 7-phosphate isomerase